MRNVKVMFSVETVKVRDFLYLYAMKRTLYSVYIERVIGLVFCIEKDALL